MFSQSLPRAAIVATLCLAGLASAVRGKLSLDVTPDHNHTRAFSNKSQSLAMPMLLSSQGRARPLPQGRAIPMSSGRTKR